MLGILETLREEESLKTTHPIHKKKIKTNFRIGNSIEGIRKDALGEDSEDARDSRDAQRRGTPRKSFVFLGPNTQDSFSGGDRRAKDSSDSSRCFRRCTTPTTILDIFSETPDSTATARSKAKKMASDQCRSFCR